MTVSECKIKVLNKNPFFGTILFSLPVIEDDNISTLGVDGENLYVNTKYWNSLRVPQQYAALIHEAGHLFLRHLWRGRNYPDVVIDPASGTTISLFNLAGDAVINHMIKENPAFELGDGWFADPKYGTTKDHPLGWTTEEVFHDLKKNTKQATPQQMKQFMENYQKGCNKGNWNKGTPKEQREAERKWSETMKQAVEYSRQRGYEPAWMKRLYEELQPKEDWRTMLREYVQPFSNDYTFNPADRRYFDGGDFVLPDIQEGQKIDWIAVAIDTSGSIATPELNAFIGELKGIMSAYDSVTVKLTFCDAEASPFTELKDFDEDKNKIKATGGGGTDFVPVFDLVKKEDTPPLCLLYFTDGYGNFPNHAPEYDTMWVTISGDHVKYPWGKVLKYKV